MVNKGGLLQKNNYKKAGDRVVLGIDPGTGRCGWAVLQLKVKSEKLKVNNGLTLLDCGLIETPAKTPLSDRLKIIFEKITELIKKHHPTEMAIEELFFVKNVKTGISVAHARGVIMLAGELANIPVFEYKPNEIKLAIAGHGHADKRQMTKMVGLHLKGCVIKQDDTVDAISIALCHLQMNRLFDHANITRMSKRELSRESEMDHANITRMSKRELSRESEMDHANARKFGRELTLESDKSLVYPELSYQIVGALYDSHNKIGSGLPERYYQAAVKEELAKRKILFRDQLKINISSLPISKGRFFLDFLIDDKIVLELKVGTRFKKENVDQVMAYLRQSGIKLAILARFGQNKVVTQRLLLGKK